MILNVWRSEDSEKSQSQMGFEPTTLRDLVGCSNHWATGDSVVSKGQFVMKSTHSFLTRYVLYSQFYRTLNIPKYEHFTRNINKIYPFLVYPSIVIFAVLDFLCHPSPIYVVRYKMLIWQQGEDRAKVLNLPQEHIERFTLDRDDLVLTFFFNPTNLLLITFRFAELIFYTLIRGRAEVITKT